MRIPITGMLQVHHPDDDVRRRGQNLVVLNVCLFLVGPLAIPVVLTQPYPTTTVLLTLTALVIFVSGLLRRATQQATLLEEIGQQRVTLRELSVPVLPVDRHTLVLPLIGALDSDHLHEVQERALAAIQEARAQRLILDVTGTPVVDTEVAQGLMAIVHGARLLGAEVVLVDMRPEVAQTIVSLGLDISGIHTFRDLHAALGQRIFQRERAMLA